MCRRGRCTDGGVGVGMGVDAGAQTTKSVTVTHVCFEVREFGDLRGETTIIAICLQGE